MQKIQEQIVFLLFVDLAGEIQSGKQTIVCFSCQSFLQSFIREPWTGPKEYNVIRFQPDMALGNENATLMKMLR